MVGIENNTTWSFKDLEEMPRSAKTLKRHNEESSGILIGPSMAPRFWPRICINYQIMQENAKDATHLTT